MAAQLVVHTGVQIAMASVLAKRDKLPKDAQTKEPVDGQPGQRNVWFPAGGGFDASVLTDPNVRNDFSVWLHSSKPGTAVQGLLRQSTVYFDQGVTNARELG
jgi:hypothetical protein